LAVRVVPSNVSRSTSAFLRDGKWIGHISDDSGRDELYVAPTSESGDKIQVLLGLPG
jgi:hypothetical protein